MSTRIREFRKLRGMTLQSLASQVGTTAQTIQRLETGNMTVSLDWLGRIADAFGMPTAALLVSQTTASVRVVGEIDGSGDITPARDGTAPTTLALIIATPLPVAVRVAKPFGSFAPGTLLIGGKIDIANPPHQQPRDCIVGLKSGKLVFRSVTINSHGIALQAVEGRGFSDEPQPDIEWLAPVLMAVRYL